MAKKLKYILFFLVVWSNTNAIACSCMYIKPVSAEALLFDGIIFKGRIIDLGTSYDNYQGEKWATGKVATFVVDRWYSSQEVSDTVIVNTSVGGGSCGLLFELGKTWLIYAHNQNGIIQSSSCTASISSVEKSFVPSVRYLENLKSKTGKIKEQLEWLNGPYTLSGKIDHGRPVGRWIRVRGNDTIAVFNFNSHGWRQGYQMEKNEDYDETFETSYERTDTFVKMYYQKELRLFYELKNGRRNGRYEEYFKNQITVKANYTNGRLSGDWTSWHDDSAIAQGKIRTMKVFEKDNLISTIRIDEATGKQIDP